MAGRKQIKRKTSEFWNSEEGSDTLIRNTRTYFHVLQGIKQLSQGLWMNAALTHAHLMWRIMQKIPTCVQPLTCGCLLQLPGHSVSSSLAGVRLGIPRYPFGHYIHTLLHMSPVPLRIKTVINHLSIFTHFSAFATILVQKQLAEAPKYENLITIFFTISVWMHRRTWLTLLHRQIRTL